MLILKRIRRRLTWYGAAFIVCSLSAAPAFGQDARTLKQLEKTIQEQQTRIDGQQQSLNQLQHEVDTLKGQTAAATVKATTDSPAAVKTGNPKASVKVYGQVNKAVLFSDDGNDTDTYLVDNDNSSTRVGLLGSIKPNDRYEIGTRIEVEYQTNPSNLVNQDDKRISDTNFEKRHLDLWVDTTGFGKFSLGWGSTASDNTAEVDLSGTSVVGYSSIPDMAGGQLFFDKNADRLSGTAIRNAFSNMDGLSRDERIRYDSPSFFGFTGSASYINDGGGDIAARYNVQVNAFKLAAAAAYSNPGSTSDTIDEQLDGSVSVLHDSGFNGTFAMGVRSHKQADRDDGGFFYTKFGYRARWCSLGVTSLSLDYGRYSDIGQDGDDADVIGWQMVQDVQAWGTEVYIGCRFHSLDRNGADYDNINAVMTGMRVKF
jgi:uncharacterized coiled-coil protein SlyX